MTILRRGARGRLAAGAALVAALAIALPVLGQALPDAPAAADAPAASPAASPGSSDKPGRGPKADHVKVPSSPVTLTGVVGRRDAENGRPEYTLTVGSTVYVLHAGPPWWWGDAHPLAAQVGRNVKIEGDLAQGTHDVDVRTVDGKVIREAGRPAWAGGPKAVGERHPGWKPWMDGNGGKPGKSGHAPGNPGHEPGPPDWARPKVSPTPAP